jgi:hypothetical protein
MMRGVGVNLLEGIQHETEAILSLFMNMVADDPLNGSTKDGIRGNILLEVLFGEGSSIRTWN